MNVCHIFGTGTCDHYDAKTLPDLYKDKHGSFPSHCMVNKCPHGNPKLYRKSNPPADKTGYAVMHMAHVFVCSDILPMAYVVPTCPGCNVGKNGTQVEIRSNAKMVKLDDCTCWRKDIKTAIKNLAAPPNW